MNLADLADEDLVTRIGNQQDSARTAFFEELVRRHEPQLLRVFSKFHPRLEDTSDLAQELYFRLWRYLTDPESASRFDPSRGSFELYLLRMARNVAIDWYRKSVRDSARSCHLPEEDQPEDDPPAGDAFSDVIFKDLLAAVERKLDDRDRAVFSLLCQDVPIAQICARTGLSQPAIWRIQQKLKKAIEEVINS